VIDVPLASDDGTMNANFVNVWQVALEDAGPEGAAAGKEANWVPTDPARKFELMFHLDAPTKALCGKTWKLPDVKGVKLGQ
jgi:hypothetical protein